MQSSGQRRATRSAAATPKSWHRPAMQVPLTVGQRKLPQPKPGPAKPHTRSARSLHLRLGALGATRSPPPHRTPVFFPEGQTAHTSYRAGQSPGRIVPGTDGPGRKAPRVRPRCSRGAFGTHAPGRVNRFRPGAHAAPPVHGRVFLGPSSAPPHTRTTPRTLTSRGPTPTPGAHLPSRRPEPCYNLGGRCPGFRIRGCSLRALLQSKPVLLRR